MIRTENYFTTSITTTVSNASTWEISIQLVNAPTSEMWVLLLNSEIEANKEEIFFHRRSWNTIYVYWINRKTPKEHNIGSSVVMNDSASLFNYILENTNTWFFIYKVSSTQVAVTSGKVFYNWTLYNVNWIILTLVEWSNYIYLDENFNIQITTTLPTWNILWLVNKTWSTVIIEKYNFVWFWFKWEDGTNWKSAYQIALDTWYVWTQAQWIASLKWLPWDIWAKWQPINVNDKQDIDISSTTTIDNTNKTITVTKADWTYIIYSETWISYYNSNWDLITKDNKTWVFSSWVITYDWLVVDWVEETTQITEWNLAYTNKDNTFENNNTFNWNVIFNWWVSFPYNRIDMTWTNVINYNWLTCENQKCINLTTTWAKTLNFSNLYQWRTYWLIINNSSSWNITLVAWSITDWNWITQIKSLWTQISTLSLAPWPHFFFMVTADTAIHISYSWLSWAF